MLVKMEKKAHKKTMVVEMPVSAVLVLKNF